MIKRLPTESQNGKALVIPEIDQIAAGIKSGLVARQMAILSNKLGWVGDSQVLEVTEIRQIEKKVVEIVLGKKD